MTYYPKNINSIRRDSIYENVLLLDNNGKCFKAPSRCPAYAPEYFCDLPVTNNPREFRGVSRRLIPSVNLAFMKIKYSYKGKDEYIVKVKDKDLDLLSLSFKDLYAVILDTKNASSKLWIGKWENDTGIQENEWNGVWANVHSKLLNQKVQSSLWETIHRNFMCAYSANIFFQESPQCKLCKTMQQSRTHIFMSCEMIVRCYNHFLPVTDLLVNIGGVDLMERAFGLKAGRNDKKAALRNYINFSIRHTVYRNRNKILGSSIDTIFKVLVKKICWNIKKDLTDKFATACAGQSFQSFIDSFLIDNILGEVIYEELRINNLF